MPQHEGFAQDAIEGSVENERHQQHSAQCRKHQQQALAAGMLARVAGCQMGLFQRHDMGRHVEGDMDAAGRAGDAGQGNLDEAADHRRQGFCIGKAGAVPAAIRVHGEDMNGLNRAAPCDHEAGRIACFREIEMQDRALRPDRMRLMAAIAHWRGGDAGEGIGIERARGVAMVMQGARIGGLGGCTAACRQGHSHQQEAPAKQPPDQSPKIHGIEA